MSQKKSPISPSPREIAFLSMRRYLKDETFLSQSISKWRSETEGKLPPRDYRLAEEIAYGTCRRLLSLNYLAKKLADRKSLKLKVKEKALLYTSLYQHFFMDKIPLFAIADQSIKIGKNYCHPTFVKFLNALLRKLEKVTPSLPKEKTTDQLSIYYSLPPFLIDLMIKDYGKERTIEIFESYLTAPKTLARPLNTTSTEKDFIEVNSSSKLSEISSSNSYYIQNPTPYLLIQKLSTSLPSPPQSIIDLCASPGGKTIAARELFPHAKLSCNDLSESKITTLRENLEKYEIEATVSISPAEKLETAEKYDLVIIDTPCSTSGVLNKRPEARWRINRENMDTLIETQKAILKKGIDLLSPNGSIWFLTCSILKEENEQLIREICSSFQLQLTAEHVILPASDSLLDGGYGCSLRKNN